MKRKTTPKLQPSPVTTRAIAAHRLTAVRGGLAIAVEMVRPRPSIMQNQHNETWIQL
jgi:hypothetical protein